MQEGEGVEEGEVVGEGETAPAVGAGPPALSRSHTAPHGSAFHSFSSCLSQANCFLRASHVSGTTPNTLHLFSPWSLSSCCEPTIRIAGSATVNKTPGLEGITCWKREVDKHE